MRIWIILLLTCLTFTTYAQSFNIEEFTQEKLNWVLEQLNGQSAAFNGASTHRLDSMINLSHLTQPQANLDEKVTYMYDNQENLIFSEHFHKLNTEVNWLNGYQQEFIYDTNNNLIESTLNRNWDPINSVYLDGIKTEHIYLTNLLSETTTLRLDSFNNWVPFLKENYVYDSAQNLIETEEFYYDLGAWQRVQKTNRSYNTSNQLIAVDFFDWDGVSWEAKKIEDYQYNSNNDVILIEISNFISGNWIDNAKINMSYLSPGILEVFEVTVNAGGWKPSSKHEYDYDPLINIISRREYVWNNTASIWTATYRKTFLYDTNHPYANLTTVLSETDCRHMVLSYINESYYGPTNTWSLNHDITYYWSELTTSSLESVLQANQLTVYPNPVTDILYFDLEENASPITIELFNVRGQLVLSKQLVNHTLDFSDLSAGYYSYKLLQKGKAYSGKVIKH